VRSVHISISRSRSVDIFTPKSRSWSCPERIVNCCPVLTTVSQEGVVWRAFLSADFRLCQCQLAIDWIAGFLFGWYLRGAELSTVGADVHAIIEFADRHVWKFSSGPERTQCESPRLIDLPFSLLLRRNLENNLSCDEPAAARV